MKKHLIISDLDGTLADVDHKVNETTKEFIRALLDMGHLFYIATGRMKVLVEEVAKDIDERVGIIGSNGGVIQTQNGFKKTPIDLKEKKQIYDYVTKNDIPTLFFTDQDVLYTHYNPQFFEIPKRNGNVVKKIDNAKEDIFDRDIVNVLLMGHYFDNPLEVLSKAREEILAHIDLTVTSSHERNLEVYSKQTSKGNALKEIINMHGIDVNNVIAFGDGYNDISMFKVASTSVAMENAPDQVKEYATHTTLTNGENGVIKFLRSHFE